MYIYACIQYDSYTKKKCITRVGDRIEEGRIQELFTDLLLLIFLFYFLYLLSLLILRATKVQLIKVHMPMFCSC